MITSVHLQDFKGHRDTSVPLSKFSVLVGPNGSGKTSVLEALWLQSRLVHAQTAAVLRGDAAVADLRRRGAVGPLVLSSAGTLNGSAWAAEIAIMDQPWSVSLQWRHGDTREEFKESRSSALGSGTQVIAQAIGGARMYKLQASNISAAAYSDHPRPEITSDGTNTAVALAALKLGYDESFDRIEEEIRRVVPNVERVRLRPEKVKRSVRRKQDTIDEVIGSKIFFDFRGAPGIPAHLASEGTLIVLALLAILHGPNRPNLLLLDDFDQSLHPQAQMDLVRLIKGLLNEMPDVQIVATTHSPYILDELEPSDVHAFALRDDGTVATKRLSEHPQADKMKGMLTAGQLWSLDPERDWVLAESTP